MTIVELIIAATIFIGLIGAIFTFLTKGNSASSKAVWRTTTTQKLRLAMRRVKGAVEATSYPLFVSNDSIFEDDSDTWKARIPAGASAVATGTEQIFTFSTPQPVLTLYNCRPSEQDLGPLATPAAGRPGSAVRYVIELVANTQNRYAPMRLQWTATPGSVTAANPPVFQPGTSGPPVILVEGVEEVRIKVPVLPAPVESMVDIRVQARDPIDGRMRLHERTHARLNVQLMQG